LNTRSIEFGRGCLNWRGYRNRWYRRCQLVLILQCSYCHPEFVCSVIRSVAIVCHCEQVIVVAVQHHVVHGCGGISHTASYRGALLVLVKLHGEQLLNFGDCSACTVLKPEAATHNGRVGQTIDSVIDGSISVNNAPAGICQSPIIIQLLYSVC